MIRAYHEMRNNSGEEIIDSFVEFWGERSTWRWIEEEFEKISLIEFCDSPFSKKFVIFCIIVYHSISVESYTDMEIIYRLFQKKLEGDWKKVEQKRLEGERLSCLVIWFRLWILYKWRRPVNDGARMRVEDKQRFTVERIFVRRVDVINITLSKLWVEFC